MCDTCVASAPWCVAIAVCRTAVSGIYSELVNELDRRYRQIPRFGVDTIRRFATNASEMKKLAARDFEDLLQCAIPAFDGLFPGEHNERVLKLLFRMAEWHSFAKLRMHTDPTLEHLKRLTPEIGRLVREFKNTTCTEFETFELPREVAARGRQEQRAANAKAAAAGGSAPAPAAPTTAKPSKKAKSLNLNIYKWHAMGDYVPAILLFGPTDGFSTQLGESLHRLLKRLYQLTNKRDHTAQIARRYIRLARTRLSAWVADDKLRRKLKAKATGGKTPLKPPVRHMRHVWHIPIQDDPFGMIDLNIHHCISAVRRAPLDIFKCFGSTNKDPAAVDFISKLQDHLLGRLLRRDFDGDTHEEFTADDRNTVRIVGNKIYATKIMRVNYTTYDVRRDQDVLNPNAQSFVMMRTGEKQAGAHPYWYAQVLGVFNATVFHYPAGDAGPSPPTIMEFLWVRWLGDEPGYRASIKKARLPKVGFVAESDPYAFGFLDPAHVVRASHLIPQFSGAQTTYLQQKNPPPRGPPPIQRTGQTTTFADRDMLMRYLGGGIGHLDVEPLSGTDIDVLEDEEDTTGDSPQSDGSDGDRDSDRESDSDSSSSEEDEDHLPALGDDEEEGVMPPDDDEMDVDGDGYAAF
ncbi:hypothetical protein C8R46DRAFT_1311106 [Mycena filopes]|nr:hypothetical protein C8R46DRAFT_1311106 [Mycena filopes]